MNTQNKFAFPQEVYDIKPHTLRFIRCHISGDRSFKQLQRFRYNQQHPNRLKEMRNIMGHSDNYINCVNCTR